LGQALADSVPGMSPLSAGCQGSFSPWGTPQTGVTGDPLRW